MSFDFEYVFNSSNNIPIPIDHSPGSMVLVGKKVKCVLSGKTYGDIFLSAVEHGKGRVIVSAYDRMKNWYNSNDYEKKIFINKINRWLTRTDTTNESDILDFNDYYDNHDDNSMKLLNNYKLIKWFYDKEIDKKSQRKLLKYISNGGSLLCAFTPWYYLEKHKENTLNDICIYNFLKNNFGVILTPRCLNNVQNTKVLFNCLQPKYTHFYEALNSIYKDGSLLPKLSKVIECGLNVLKKENLITYEKIKSIKDYVIKQCELYNWQPFPQDDQSVQSDESKSISTLLCQCYIVLENEKAPSISYFPGDYKQTPYLLNNRKVNLKPGFAERISTGYYVPAGVLMNIKVFRGNTNGWKVRIGAHTDNIEQRSEYKRWPVVTIVENLTNNMNICSPFGGLLYFESPKGNTELCLIINNVVEAPFFDANKKNPLKYWKSNAPGLWAELMGKHIIITCPSDSIRQLTNPIEIVKFWDSVVEAQHKCRGTNPYDYRRERIVCDKQTSVGYMHSGYPIVTHLDICYDTSRGCILNLKQMKQFGNWGLFHEIGHNMQRKEWTFDGCTEVTVNIFSMYCMQFIVGKDMLKQPWLINQRHKFKNYFCNKPCYDDWKNNYHMALFTFVQLIKHFGWSSMCQFLKSYEIDRTSKRHLLPKTNQDKIDQWVTRYSLIVNRNIKTQFNMWGLPVSNYVDDVVQDLKLWHPIDEIDYKVFFKR